MKILPYFVALLAGVWTTWAFDLGARQAGNMTDTVAELPACATSCILSAAVDSSCGLTDTKCLCEDVMFGSTSGACIFSSCSVVDTLYSKNISETICGRPVRDRGTEYVRVNCAMLGLVTVVVTARLFYKYLSPQPLGLDDLFALLTSLAMLPAFFINLIGLIPSGIGRDIWTLSPDQINDFGFYFFLLVPLYFLQIGLAKMAILAFFLRVFDLSGIEPLLWATIAFNAANTVAFIFAGIFQCIPVSYFWHHWQGTYQGACVNLNALTVSNAVITIALDLWMLGLPLIKIQSLKLPWWEKMAAGLMFGVGTFVTIISILRLHAIIVVGNTSITSRNPTWDQFNLAIWSALEVNIAIICSCLPAMRQIINKTMSAMSAWSGWSRRRIKCHDDRSPWSSVTDGDARKPVASMSRGLDVMAVEYGSPAAAAKLARPTSPGHWNSISEMDDTAQLYGLRELKGNADDKNALRCHDTVTSASSIAQ